MCVEEEKELGGNGETVRVQFGAFNQRKVFGQKFQSPAADAADRAETSGSQLWQG